MCTVKVHAAIFIIPIDCNNYLKQNVMHLL